MFHLGKSTKPVASKYSAFEEGIKARFIDKIESLQNLDRNMLFIKITNGFSFESSNNKAIDTFYSKLNENFYLQ